MSVVARFDRRQAGLGQDTNWYTVQPWYAADAPDAAFMSGLQRFLSVEETGTWNPATRTALFAWFKDYFIASRDSVPAAYSGETAGAWGQYPDRSIEAIKGLLMDVQTFFKGARALYLGLGLQATAMEDLTAQIDRDAAFVQTAIEKIGSQVANVEQTELTHGEGEQVATENLAQTNRSGKVILYTVLGGVVVLGVVLAIMAYRGKKKEKHT